MHTTPNSPPIPYNSLTKITAIDSTLAGLPATGSYGLPAHPCWANMAPSSQPCHVDCTLQCDSNDCHPSCRNLCTTMTSHSACKAAKTTWLLAACHHKNIGALVCRTAQHARTVCCQPVLARLLFRYSAGRSVSMLHNLKTPKREIQTRCRAPLGCPKRSDGQAMSAAQRSLPVRSQHRGTPANKHTQWLLPACPPVHKQLQAGTTFAQGRKHLQTKQPLYATVQPVATTCAVHVQT